jgi:ankyrin repeat protein
MKSRNQTKASNPDLERRFILAAKYGNLPQVQDCWWQNVHPNATGSDGWTALHWACAKGHLPVVQWLVQHGHVNVDAAGLQGETPLHCACQSGQKDVVKYLVQEGHTNVNVPAADGRTPFDVAWEERQEEIVQLLSDRPKLQPNFVANSSSSSDIVSSAKLEQRLIAAAQQGHLDHVQECCRRHVNENVAGRDRWTALHWSSRHGRLDMVRCLVHGGKANVELKTKSGWTALHWACKTGHLDVVKVLVLECAADTDATTNGGSTPLQLAKQNGQQDVVTFLSNLPECRPVAAAQRKSDDTPNAKLEQRFLEAAKNGYLDHVTDCWLQGVNVNAQSSDGWMALHSASFKGHLNVVQWLVQHGKVDIEATTNSVWTALHCACQSGQVAVVKYLVEDCGANTNAMCMDGKSPFDVAWQKRQLDVVKVLSDLPNDRSTANGSLDLPCTNLEQQFLDAAENGHLDQVIECCQLHVNVNALSSSNGWTALHWAGQKGHLDIVQWLVQSCKLDVDTKGLDGQTPLHCACQTGQLDVVKY